MKTNTITAVPRLRFPEFQEEEGWERSEFNKVYDLKITNSLSRAKLNYVKGSVKNIHYGDIHTQFSALFDINKEEVPFIDEEETNYKSETGDFCIEGDIVLADASEDIKDIGKSIEIINITNQKIVCGLHTIHARPKKNKLYIGFGAYLFQSHFIRTQIQLESQGAKVLGLSKGRLDKINLLLPKTDEQQKIADCLSSLDTLIKAEDEQLNTLKEYKAGLLQQLFPAEGETMPKRRFAEFEGDGDWEEVSLNNICHFVRGPFGGALKKDIFVENGYAVYEQAHAIYGNFDSFRYFITQQKFDELKRFEVKADDLIMSCSGTMGKFSRIPKNPKKGVINQALLKLTVKKGYSTSFIKNALELPLNQSKLLSQSAGGAVKNVVGVSLIKQITIAVPNIDEQNRITECITLLDDLIESQSKKIEALKQHKQGLMQQLFPVMDGK